jgi:hypothetical protein
MLPGRNAGKKDGTDPRTWFRQIFNSELEKTCFGGETFAETLHHLLGEDHKVEDCPNPDCDEKTWIYLNQVKWMFAQSAEGRFCRQTASGFTHNSAKMTRP